MNFALMLFSLLLVTGAVALADGVWLARRRREGDKEPWWIEYGKSFFPVILIVFVLRSFLVEPFKIPSGSMVPTLLLRAGRGRITCIRSASTIRSSSPKGPGRSSIQSSSRRMRPPRSRSRSLFRSATIAATIAPGSSARCRRGITS